MPSMNAARARRWAMSTLLVTALLSPHAAEAASAQSTLELMTLRFTLASAAESVSVLPVTSCTDIGAADCEDLGVEGNFPIVATGPTPADEPLEVRLFGTAFADAPPGAYSLAIGKIVAFLVFANIGPDPLDIDVTVGGAYYLAAFGDTSMAAIEATVTQTDDVSGVVLVPETSLVSDAVPNDGEIPGDIDDSFVVSVFPFSATVVEVDVELTAEARVSEPSTLLALSAGLLATLGLRRRCALWRA
jgi:hypothetical protein